MLGSLTWRIFNARELIRAAEENHQALALRLARHAARIKVVRAYWLTWTYHASSETAQTRTLVAIAGRGSLQKRSQTAYGSQLCAIAAATGG